MVKKGKKKLAPPNQVRPIRASEGLMMTGLAKLASVSTKSISGIETRKRNLSSVLKHRIVNGFNANPNRKRTYAFRDVFPNDPEE
jgi:DNA-binding XRE family transcriptional regulator